MGIQSVLNIKYLLIFFATSALFIVGIHSLILILIYTQSFEHFYNLDFYFDLDNEFNIPAYFSTFILFFTALLLGKIFKASEGDCNRKVWAVLSAVFVILALDELLSFHEKLVHPIRNQFDLTGYFFFSWVLILGPIVICLFLYLIPFLKSLPKGYAVKFMIAGAIYVSGAIGFEMIGANNAYETGYVFGWRNPQDRGTVYAIIVTIEETLEICGLLFFNFALSQYLDKIKNVRYLG